jgi:hypothetical protein
MSCAQIDLVNRLGLERNRTIVGHLQNLPAVDINACIAYTKAFSSPGIVVYGCYGRLKIVKSREDILQRRQYLLTQID